MKKSFILILFILCAGLILSACGEDEKITKEEQTLVAGEQAKKDDEDSTDKKEKKEKEKADIEESEESKDENEDTVTESEEIITYMEEATEGKAKVLFEDNQKQTHKLDDIIVDLEEYSVLELNDFHRDHELPFGGQTNGGVILAKYSIENKSGKDAFYMPQFYGSYTGSTKSAYEYKDLIPVDKQLTEVLSPKSDYLLKADEKVKGYIAYPFSQTEFKTIQSLATIQIEVPEAQAKNNDLSSRFGKRGKFTISLNEAGARKTADNAKFFEDKVTKDNMGEKKLIKDKENINKIEKLGKVIVTLDGYQFTKFTPNEVEAEKFESYKNGIVLLTVKFNLENKDARTIAKTPISSKLTMNDGADYTLNEGMLLPYGSSEIIKTNEKGELLQAFVIDGEKYEKILKDKEFEIEVGPMRDEDYSDMSKGNVVKFNLPE